MRFCTARTGCSDFSADDQDRLARAQRLLRLASDGGATPQERQHAYTKALLAAVLHLGEGEGEGLDVNAALDDAAEGTRPATVELQQVAPPREGETVLELKDVALEYAFVFGELGLA